MAALITPTSTEELSAAVVDAAQRGVSMTPTGGGTKLTWGNPVETALHVSTKKLGGVREHSWQDLTATVGAGTTWAAMNDELAKHGQRVALDPLFPAHATVGGVLATNDSGLLRMKFGSLRDLVIGMTIVLADGTIARTGGKVVKNVAGYDLPKLLTGSFGTLGIITEATFRLHPVAQHTATFTVRSADVASLADLMSAILKARLSVEAMQLRTETLAFALDVRLASLPDVLLQQEQTMYQLAHALMIESAPVSVFGAREHLFAHPEATVLKITALPTKLAAIVAGIAQLDSQPDYEAQCVADPVGIVTASLSGPAYALGEVVEDLRDRLAANGGAVVVLQRGSLPEAVSTWGPEPPAIDVMRALKQEFDPQSLLNPGKFVGGI